uniref:Secreted protein n=1 Tax=Panagrolaimus sp. JU765 TaxID=591449 RepID=A0AC34QWK4_9BILA
RRLPFLTIARLLRLLAVRPIAARKLLSRVVPDFPIAAFLNCRVVHGFRSLVVPQSKFVVSHWCRLAILDAVRGP